MSEEQEKRECVVEALLLQILKKSAKRNLKVYCDNFTSEDNNRNYECPYNVTIGDVTFDFGCFGSNPLYISVYVDEAKVMTCDPIRGLHRYATSPSLDAHVHKVGTKLLRKAYDYDAWLKAQSEAEYSEKEARLQAVKDRFSAQ